MAAVEAEARGAGRWLLVLDTETQSNGQQLYAAMGYQAAGIIPDFAIATILSFHRERSCRKSTLLNPLAQLALRFSHRELWRKY